MLILLRVPLAKFSKEERKPKGEILLCTKVQFLLFRLHRRKKDNFFPLLSVTAKKIDGPLFMRALEMSNVSNTLSDGKDTNESVSNRNLRPSPQFLVLPFEGLLIFTT